MAWRTPLISDFTAGELAPSLVGRTDQPVYYKGASLMRNFMPRSQGGFRKRPGTLFVGHTAGDNPAQLASIRISSSLSYILEFTNGLLRFWKLANGALSYLSGKDIVAPYQAADLSTMQFAWLAPDLFIVHQNYPPARVRWSTGDNFAYLVIQFVTTTFSFTANMVAGSNTLTNLSRTDLPVAAASGLWLLTGNGIPAGTYLTQVYPSATASTGVQALSATMNNNASGTLVGVQLTLTQQPIPFQGTGNYPKCVAVAFQRVWFADTINNPQTLWSSIVGVWDSNDPTGASANMNMNTFEATTYSIQQMVVDASGVPTTNPPSYQNIQQSQNAVADSDGIQITLAETNSEILWIAAGNDLIVGTAQGEIVIPGSSTANNVAALPISQTGSAPIPAIQLTNGIIFTQLASQRIYELNWQGTQNPRVPPRNLSFFSTQIFQSNAVTWFKPTLAPDLILYFGRKDGTVAAVIYDAVYQVMAWWQLVTRSGDSIQSAAVVSASDRDILVISVTRGAFNYIEMLSTPDWTDVRTSCYMDAATQVQNGAPSATINVDTSFNGQTMGVVADGKYLGTAVPSGGVLTLPGGVTATYVTVGFLYTALMKTMPITPDGDYGTGVLKMKGSPYIRVSFYNTLDAQLNVDGLALYPANFQQAANINVANPTPFTGYDRVPIDSDWTTVQILDVQSQNPLPCEVTALVPEVTISE